MPMGGGEMSFLAPDPPKMPEMPPMPTEADAENAALLEAQKQKRRKGFTSTILTDSESLGSAPTKKKTLLGE